MNDSMIEQKPDQSIERSPSNAANIAVSNRFKRLGSEARHKVNGWVKKGTLTASALFLIVASGCGNTREAESQVTPEPTPTSISSATTTPIEIPIPTSAIPVSEPISKSEATSTPTPLKSTEDIKLPIETPKAIEYHYMDVSDDIKVAIDKEGLPAKYIILSTGEEVYFDKEEVKKLREKAISSKEPEIIKMFLQTNPASIPEFNYQESDAAKHPTTPDLPEDVVSEVDLEKRGITIFQPENTNLFIREGAFAKGGIFEDFNSPEDRRLIIVFLNGSTITQKYFNDPKYSEVINYIPKKFLSAQDRRESIIADSEEQLEILHRDKKKLIQAWGGEPYQYEYGTLYFKAEILKYKDENFMTDEQISRAALGINFGWYQEGNGGLIPGSQKTPTMIFISVDQQDKYNFPIVYFDPNGKISVIDFTNDYGKYRGKLFPTVQQTHPNPKDFKKDSNTSFDIPPYAITNRHLGFVLRHENEHRKLIEERERKNEKPDFSEYNTDIQTMEGITKAWDKWEKSGFKDDSGYPFIFSLPKEQGGGYILTRKKRTVSEI